MLALAAVLVSVGVQLQTIASLRERVRRLERGAQDQGGRLEALGLTAELIADRIGLQHRRRLSIVQPVEEKGEDTT